MSPIVDEDLPLLEVLAAAPDRLVPADKLEPLALLMMARRLLATGSKLRYSPSNGRPVSAESLRAAFDSALRYRAVFLSREQYGLTEDGGLYLQTLGVKTPERAREFVASQLGRPTADLQAEADALVTV
jgi:hypothetical protein